jgi:hypothetical protein
MFSDLVCKQLKYYVYGLKDPRDNQYFYIGKGEENRVYFHLTPQNTGLSTSEKSEKITEIRSVGLEPTFDIIRWGITDEKVAYEIEAAIIDTLNVQHLTNLVRGHGTRLGYGLMSEQKTKEMFDGGSFESSEKFVGFKLNRLWNPELTDEELYEVTRKMWRIGPRRDTAEYALAVSYGIVRQVYRIGRFTPESKWEPFSHSREGKLMKRKRWGFVGVIAEELQHLVNSKIDHLPNTKGQNPVFYLNC